MTPEHSAELIKIMRGVNTSKRLEKIAQDFKDDPEVFKKASMLKIAADAEVFELIKKANFAGQLGRKALTGLAYGAGAGVPIALGGSYLLHRAKEDTEETTGDIRNKVLQTALGLGGIGAGLYGLHRLTGGGPLLGGKPLLENKPRLFAPEEKKASCDNNLEELVEKLATVGMVDDMLDQADNVNLSESAKKLAAEVRILNRGYGVQLLYEASYK